MNPLSDIDAPPEIRQDNNHVHYFSR